MGEMGDGLAKSEGPDHGGSEDFCSFSTGTGTLSAAPALLSPPRMPSGLQFQAELPLSYMLMCIDFPFDGGPFFAIHCDEGARLETGGIRVPSPGACPGLAEVRQ